MFRPLDLIKRARLLIGVGENAEYIVSCNGVEYTKLIKSKYARPASERQPIWGTSKSYENYVGMWFIHITAEGHKMRSKEDKVKRLEQIAAKTKYSIRNKGYYCNLRPDDILFLIQNKYIKDHVQRPDMRYWTGQIKDGRQSLTTFYFERPLGTLKELLANKFVSDHGSSALQRGRERL